MHNTTRTIASINNTSEWTSSYSRVVCTLLNNRTTNLLFKLECVCIINNIMDTTV